MDYEFPPAALFKTISHCRRCEQTPRIDGHLGEWSSAFALPPLHELGGGRGYANLSMGWDERGLYVAAEVPRVEPVVVNRQNPAAGDALELFIDTRAGQTGHRATQFVARRRRGAAECRHLADAHPAGHAPLGTAGCR